MNKYAFLSGFFTLILSFLEFIPLGINFGSPGLFSNWILTYLGFSNPLMSYYETFSLALMNYGDYEIFLWGLIQNGTLYSWVEIHPLTFIFFFILSILAILASFIASFKSTKFGKRMANLNLICIVFIFGYFLIGIPIYSQQIIGIQYNYFDIFFNLNYGFYLLSIDSILSIFSYIKHSIE